MKKNELDIFDYVAGIVLWAFIVLCWYEKLVYMPIPGLPSGDSYRVYLMLVVGVVIVNLLVTAGWYRNFWSLAATVLLPFGIYTFLAYRKVMPVLFGAVAVIGGLLGLAYVVYAATAHSMCINPRRVREIRIKKSFVVVRTLAALAGTVLILCTAVRLYIPSDLSGVKQNTEFAYTDEYRLDNNLDTVMLLWDDEWKKLPVSERVRVLQCVSHIEGRYLGLTREVAVQVKELSEGVAIISFFHSPFFLLR